VTSSAADDDFRNEVFWAVQEGAFLFEVPGGATDLLPDGPVVHGPWDPDTCSSALLAWFEHGWLRLEVPPEQLFRWDDTRRQALSPDTSDPSWHVMDAHAAREVLRQPSLWTQEHPEGFLCLGLTATAPDATWRDLWTDALNSA
jgi:hypothetical protein